MDTCLKFVILTEKEENELISDINSNLDREQVAEYKVIKRGICSGLWRKTKQILTDTYYTMEFKNDEMNSPDSHFGICISTSLREIAAVYYSNQSIQRLIYFPNHKETEWKYLWNGYKKSISTVLKTNLNLRILSSKVSPDELSHISTFLRPVWCSRLKNPCWDSNPEPSP